jgi:hypothetical protein
MLRTVFNSEIRLSAKELYSLAPIIPFSKVSLSESPDRMGSEKVLVTS